MPAWITSELRLLVSVPICPCRSSTSTSRPVRASARAHASPTTPAPTTTQSTRSAALMVERGCVRKRAGQRLAEAPRPLRQTRPALRDELLDALPELVDFFRRRSEVVSADDEADVACLRKYRLQRLHLRLHREERTPLRRGSGTRHVPVTVVALPAPGAARQAPMRRFVQRARGIVVREEDLRRLATHSRYVQRFRGAAGHQRVVGAQELRVEN